MLNTGRAFIAGSTLDDGETNRYIQTIDVTRLPTISHISVKNCVINTEGEFTTVVFGIIPGLLRISGMYHCLQPTPSALR